MPLPPPPVGPFDTTILLDNLNNTYTGTLGADLIQGAGGDDLLNGDAGNDYLDGGSGNDRLTAGRGDDTLVGGDGNDRLIGGSGAQMLFGGTGDDVIQSGDRSSTLDGGEGNDILTALLSKGATHTLTGGSGLDSFEITGAAIDRIGTVIFTDFQVGVDGFTVDGIAGSQILNAGRAITMLDGGGMAVTLASGDILRFDGVRSEDIWRFYGLSGADTVTGSASADRVFVGNGANVVDGGAGHDMIVAGNHADLLTGGEGNDTLNGLGGNDTVYGGDGDDLIHDSRGTNMLYGGNGNDRINSGSDASLVDGGEGDDWLISRTERGAGHTLIGGLGADTFDFQSVAISRGYSATITDFTAGEDSLMIAGMDGFEWIALQGYGIEEDEAGTTVTFGNGEIVFAGLTAEDLDALIPDLIVS